MQPILIVIFSCWCVQSTQHRTKFGIKARGASCRHCRAAPPYALASPPVPSFVPPKYLTTSTATPCKVEVCCAAAGSTCLHDPTAGYPLSYPSNSWIVQLMLQNSSADRRDFACSVLCARAVEYTLKVIQEAPASPQPQWHLISGDQLCLKVHHHQYSGFQFRK
jgi:hypothetical protein